MIQAIEDIIPEGSKLAHVYNVLIVVSWHQKDMIKMPSPCLISWRSSARPWWQSRSLAWRGPWSTSPSSSDTTLPQVWAGAGFIQAARNWHMRLWLLCWLRQHVDRFLLTPPKLRSYSRRSTSVEAALRQPPSVDYNYSGYVSVRLSSIFLWTCCLIDVSLVFELIWCNLRAGLNDKGSNLSSPGRHS